MPTSAAVLLAALVLVGAVVAVDARADSGHAWPRSGKGRVLRPDSQVSNQRATIGVMMQPFWNTSEHETYVPASYVKWIESAGIRAIPIRHDASLEQLRWYASRVNGFLVPGGGSPITADTDMWRTTKFFMEHSYDGDSAFPVWGTCLGFEIMACITADSPDCSILSLVDARNISLPLDLSRFGWHNSNLLAAAPMQVLAALTGKPVTMHAHRRGVTLDDWNANAKLGLYWEVVGTSKDRKGVEFVAAIEAKGSHVYATQFHPEKPMYEWRVDEAIPHDSEAIMANQYLAQLLADTARSSAYRFDSEQQLVQASFLVRNPEYTGDWELNYQQMYYIDDDPCPLKKKKETTMTQ